jgi:hypothetical protein
VSLVAEPASSPSSQRELAGKRSVPSALEECAEDKGSALKLALIVVAVVVLILAFFVQPTE